MMNMTDLRAIESAKRVIQEWERNCMSYGFQVGAEPDAMTCARAVLASLDVPDREQLLRDVESIEKNAGVWHSDTLLRLAAHTRRTILGEK